MPDMSGSSTSRNSKSGCTVLTSPMPLTPLLAVPANSRSSYFSNFKASVSMEAASSSIIITFCIVIEVVLNVLE